MTETAKYEAQSAVAFRLGKAEAMTASGLSVSLYILYLVPSCGKRLGIIRTTKAIVMTAVCQSSGEEKSP